MTDYVRRPRKRYCFFCKEKIEYIDYKDTNLLKKFFSDKGKIKPRRVSGSCKQHQRDLSIAIKRSREIALLPYVTRHYVTKQSQTKR